MKNKYAKKANSERKKKLKWQGLEIEGNINTGEKTRKRERREGQRKVG